MEKALFLDRDGVVNTERQYVHRRETFEFQDGIFELCKAAQDHGYLSFVITNQAGIARGYYTEADFLRLTEWMLGQFKQHDVHVSRVYYCPYHPVHGIGKYKRDSPDRKPGPGMLLRARDDFHLDLKSSVLVGDNLTDIQAAEAAGVGTRILLRAQGFEAEPSTDGFYVAESLADIRDQFFPELGLGEMRW